MALRLCVWRITPFCRSSFYQVKKLSYMNSLRFQSVMCKFPKPESKLTNCDHPMVYFSSETSKTQIQKHLQEISEKFSEALELLNDARSSLGTVYFSDDMKEAEELVEEILKDYKTLLQQLNEEQRLEVQRSIGLKMEELQAQLTLIKSTPTE